MWRLFDKNLPRFDPNTVFGEYASIPPCLGHGPGTALWNRKTAPSRTILRNSSRYCLQYDVDDFSAMNSQKASPFARQKGSAAEKVKHPSG